MYLGKCPMCEDGSIEVREKNVSGKKVKLFACSNAHWYSEDGELYELSTHATCDFKIWQNALACYGKWFTYQDIRQLLDEHELRVTLISKKWGKKISYEKMVVIDPTYGVSVVWDEV